MAPRSATRTLGDSGVLSLSAFYAALVIRSSCAVSPGRNQSTASSPEYCPSRRDYSGAKRWRQSMILPAATRKVPLLWLSTDKICPSALDML
ncbi:hypothetical protein FA95DRAFT_1565890 [Auriscalpium vulgare]|uniref:Uncharacterized protein n=1 Tax=Auriscalpium vulgare TaxID=40419 RepID=A0ACB8RAD3_9AGAM|nr:hypothetical protein FA95DRAFT_1565890 [Auriscalpium vulgare]